MSKAINKMKAFARGSAWGSKVKTALVLIFLCITFVSPLIAQVDSNLTDDPIDAIIEDSMSDLESDDQTDWTPFTDRLEDLLKHPLNLNSATLEELLALPGLNSITAKGLIDYIFEFGALSSIYELQAVPGFDLATFQKIKPYVTVGDARAKDISPGVVHPQGPSLKEILKESSHEWLNRTVFTVEEQKGYTPADTSSTGRVSSRYLGSKYRLYSRYRWRFARNFSVALTAEKDPGEKFEWAPKQNTYGFDYLSGHFFLRDFGRLKRLVVGDYTLQTGQGLALSSGLGFGKGAAVINSLKRRDFGIRPYASVNENQFMRGAAATYAIKNLYFTGFFSRTGLDANISARDTLTDEIELVSTLQTSGFHRTTSELEDKDAIKETMYGGRLQYKSRWLNVGATHFFQDFGADLQPSAAPYQRFNFSGQQNFLTSVDADLTYKNFNFFGEFARSKSGGTGLTAGMLSSLSPTVSLSLLYRRFERDFHSNRAFVFAERPTTARNETGIYAGLEVTPNPKWVFSSYFDQFWFPWQNFTAAFPSQGYEYMAQLMYKPKRSTAAYIRYRSDNKETNATEFEDGQQVEYIIPTRKQYLRFQFDHKLDRNVKIRTRAEHSWWKRGDEEQTTGFLIFQDLTYKIGYKLKLTGRYAIFNVEDYDARIYAYENDVLGFFSIPAYYRQGSRYYLIVNYKPTRNLEFWLRYARSKFPNENTLGSGLNEIQGSTQSEIKLQFRLKF